MAMTRRRFLRSGLLAVSGLGLAACAGTSAGTGAAARSRPPPPQDGPQKHLLVLAGDGFVASHLVEAALARAHVVSVLGGEQLDPTLRARVTVLAPSAADGPDPLEGRSWNAVVDCQSRLPRELHALLPRLERAFEQYVFLSSATVYPEPDPAPQRESAPIGGLRVAGEIPRDEDGASLAACELALTAVLRARLTRLRPALLCGPGDPSDRFTFWPVRIARAGELLGPGDGEDPVQLCDVRDLAEFAVKAVEDRLGGAFNVASPPLRMRELVGACRAASGGAPQVTWVDAEFLAYQQVHPWRDLPAWKPRGSEGGFPLLSCERALARGLRPRPLAETARDVLDWWEQQPTTRALRAGIPAEREARLLAAWKRRAG
ncbi:MAG TPA: NAD-dependent epimerase/dehydratase family protein [Anaeromyxobacteraceae bacterium]|jgi:2'-hydroxyisoflavone reductase|nr:NAD-dependent epimerase/dehydratase family protein [Anaeromyxobacteraceae bacterium]